MAGRPDGSPRPAASERTHPHTWKDQANGYPRLHPRRLRRRHDRARLHRLRRRPRDRHRHLVELRHRRRQPRPRHRHRHDLRRRRPPDRRHRDRDRDRRRQQWQRRPGDHRHRCAGGDPRRRTRELLALPRRQRRGPRPGVGAGRGERHLPHVRRRPGGAQRRDRRQRHPPARRPHRLDDGRRLHGRRDLGGRLSRRRRRDARPRHQRRAVRLWRRRARLWRQQADRRRRHDPDPVGVHGTPTPPATPSRSGRSTASSRRWSAGTTP